MKPITREQLNEKMRNDIPIIEVLDAEQYRDFHLPQAINVPLGEDFEARIQEVVPDKSQEVVVYCYDTECQASPKAARQMEQLGYKNVYDYEAGKMDWKAAGLPVES